MISCELDEDQLSIISRFKTGLRDDIKVELELREVSTLDEAYKIADKSEILNAIRRCICVQT